MEVILAIRKAMSEEAAHDIPTFVEMIRTGARPADAARTVTREEGSTCDESQPVTEQPKVSVADE